MALLLERNPPVRINGAIFISFYLERSVVGRWKKTTTLLLKSWEYCLRDSWSVCFHANEGHLLHHHRNACGTALQRYRPGFSPESHLSSSRAKHVHLKKREKLKRCAFLHFSFFLLCAVITGVSGLCIYKSFMVELMHCTGGRVPTLAVITLAGDTVWFHLGSPILFFNLHPIINMFEALVHSMVLYAERRGWKKVQSY